MESLASYIYVILLKHSFLHRKILLSLGLSQCWEIRAKSKDHLCIERSQWPQIARMAERLVWWALWLGRGGLLGRDTEVCASSQRQRQPVLWSAGREQLAGKCAHHQILQVHAAWSTLLVIWADAFSGPIWGWAMLKHVRNRGKGSYRLASDEPILDDQTILAV